MKKKKYWFIVYAYKSVNVLKGDYGFGNTVIEIESDSSSFPLVKTILFLEKKLKRKIVIFDWKEITKECYKSWVNIFV